MKEIAEKLRDLERELKDEKGPFAYFALAYVWGGQTARAT